ncbi:MAG: zinc ribbon domain-containing protein [Candidatus Hodarchaeales archaeon]
MFKQKLRAKCDFHGINYRETEESYTSRTYSTCGHVDKKARVKRGLYVCTNFACHAVINADINGTINILKKVNPNPTWIGASGGVNPPVRMSFFRSHPF